jgi:hypothetical protein
MYAAKKGPIALFCMPKQDQLYPIDFERCALLGTLSRGGHGVASGHWAL